MSLYNLMNGFNPATIIILPMLGRSHECYPRFRDCFVNEENIEIYTRVGGNNRGCGFGEDELYKNPNFVTTYDDDFDSTYGTYVFKVPQKWEKDFKMIMNDEMNKVSDEYVNEVKRFYPDLTHLIDACFQRGETNE